MNESTPKSTIFVKIEPALVYKVSEAFVSTESK